MTSGHVLGIILIGIGVWGEVSLEHYFNLRRLCHRAKAPHSSGILHFASNSSVSGNSSSSLGLCKERQGNHGNNYLET
ncbi:hypothetical protein QZH41_016902, partial [Actinostola sp. cb2023]